MLNLINVSDLNKLLVSLLDAGFAAYTANPYNGGRPLPANIEAVSGMQPRQQGANIDATVYVQLGPQRPIGFPKRTLTWDADNELMMHVQGQRMETTYHIEAWVPQSPATPDAMTEMDVLNIARFILTSDETIATLQPLNVGLLRVLNMPSLFIDDDREQHENVPFFEITFSHRMAITQTAPVVEEFQTVFARV
jgi:hypothetical protein